MLLFKVAKQNISGILRRRNIRNIVPHRYYELSFEDIPEVSSSIIKKTLNKNNISFEEGYTCFIIHCPVCCKSTKKPTSSVYLNKMTGTYDHKYRLLQGNVILFQVCSCVLAVII